MQRTGSNVCFHTNDGLNTVCLGLFVEFNCARHSAVVGLGYSCHAAFFDIVNQRRQLGSAVQQTVLRVIVQMHIVSSTQLCHSKPLVCPLMSAIYYTAERDA